MKCFGHIFRLLLLIIPVVVSAQNQQRVDSLTVVLSMAEDEAHRVDILLELATEYITNDPDKAIEYSLQALDLSHSNSITNGQITSQRILAELYWSTTQYRKALEMAAQARQLAYDHKASEEVALANQVFGLVYSDLGDYEKSSQYFFESLKLFEELKDTKGISKSLNSIGYVLFEQEHYDKAEEYYSRALLISRSIGDPIGIARGLNNLAAVYGNQKDYEKVRTYLYEAIALNKLSDQLFWVGINYQNLGVINREEKNYDSAFYYYTKAIDIFQELNHVSKLARVYIGLSKYYYDLEQTTKSIEFAETAFQLGQQHKLVKVEEEAAGWLHTIYREQNEVAMAYEYGILHYRLKDSLEIVNSLTRLSQLELLHEFDKISQEQQLQEQKKEYTYLIVIIVLIFVLIVTTLYFVMRQRIRRKNTQLEKKKLHNALEIKNKELTSNVMSLMKKNEVLADIADKLLDVQESAVRAETKHTIGKIARELQKTSDDEIWEEFDTRFKQVHGAFYDKLIEQFPDLTPNELKLCAFLRLNMTTKEISELTGQRISTLEIARSRLRKKLGLVHTKTNLITFLSQI